MEIAPQELHGGNISRMQGAMATAKKKRTKSLPLWLKLTVVLVAVLMSVAIYFRVAMASKIELGTAFGARIACACHHIGGRPLNQCTADFEPGMELVFLSEDASARSVTAYVPLVESATATYRDGYGCVLEPWGG